MVTASGSDASEEVIAPMRFSELQGSVAGSGDRLLQQCHAEDSVDGLGRNLAAEAVAVATATFFPSARAWRALSVSLACASAFSPAVLLTLWRQRGSEIPLSRLQARDA